MSMPSGASPTVPTVSTGLTRDRSYRLTPAGPRRRADTKSDVKPPAPRQYPSGTTLSNVVTAAGPSTSSITVNLSQTGGSVDLRRKEMMASGSRNKTTSRDAQSAHPYPPRSHSFKAAAQVTSPLGRSPASDAGRYGTIKATAPPTSSPTQSSSFSSANPARATSSRIGPVSQRSYESFADPWAHQTLRRTTGLDPQASPSSHSHIQSSPSPSTSESFRAHPASSRASGGQASASISRKSSVGTGTGSDREGGGHLDLKRLLSKPALPNHSGSSIISLPSDPEPSASPSASRRLMTAQAQAHDILRQRTLANAASSSSSRPLREKASARSMSALAESTFRPAIRDPTPRVSLTPPSREPERERGPSSNLKPRAVLKRRPSGRSGTSTPTITTSNSAQTNSFSSNETSRAPRQPARSSDTTRPPATPSSAASRRVGSVVADPVSVRGGLKDFVPPVGLTPAGAVAHAYKQQEERREKLAEISGWNDQQRPLHLQRSQSSLSSLSFAHTVPVVESEPSLADSSARASEGSGGPYYTVFGRSSDRLVAASGREDDWKLNFDAYYGCSGPQTIITSVPTKPASGHGSGTTSGMKGLTRKMSGKLRKVAGVGRGGKEEFPQSVKMERKETSESHVDEKERMPYDGKLRISQDRGAMSLDVGRASSVDSFVKVEVREKTSVNGSSQRQPVNAFRRSHKLSRTDDKEKHKPKHREDESSSGGKLWKLMKRISTGGLRDKYNSPRDESPPPVPALPKDLPSRLTLDIQKPPSDELVGESGILLSRFMQSRSSMSGVRPSTAPVSHRPAARAGTDPRSRPSTGNKADPRPSTTTRSSSPMSSDIASTKFFQKTHSNRSSTTSYGEELPPLPNNSYVLPLSQHIISPSELYRLDNDGDEASHPATPLSTMTRRKPTRSRSAPDDPSFLTSPIDDPRPSLPFPPRRPPQSVGGKPLSYSPPSPTIPAFNTTAAVNNFPVPPALSLSMSEFGVSEALQTAPPRPPRSSKRHTSSSDGSPSSGSTSKSSPGCPSPRTPILPSLSIDVFSRSRRSISTTSRSQVREVPVSPSPLSASPHTRSPLTFRQIESPRAALSQEEKAAKWDDLLERSAKAGGTLHLGETGLMSDNLRFSVVSEG